LSLFNSLTKNELLGRKNIGGAFHFLPKLCL